MNTSSRPRSKFGSFLSRLLYTGVSVWMLGAVYTPALAAVTVDQSPLIIQRSLPPNVVLMLDDSGSMAWDVMPDYGYLTSTSADALVSSDNNGVYYNPANIYTPPPNADGTLYAASTFTAAWINGFSNTTTVNLATYNGGQDDTGKSTNQINFTKSFSYTASSVVPSCPSSTTGGTATAFSGPTSGLCTATWSSANSSNGSNFYGDKCSKRNGNNQTCTKTYSACLSGASYNSANGMCETSATVGFFSFTVANSTPVTSSTTYTRHYVAANSGDCALAGLSRANAADGYPICDESTNTQQNVANWFSYYHTRILMAKSGVMSAFVTVDQSFRVGFGSIGGSNKDALGSDYYSFTTTAGRNSWSTGLALVKPLGDGSAGTQKKKLWDWLAGTSPLSSTPLRGALDAVGRYYGTDQPWTGMDSDPDQGTAAGSTELACRQSYTILTTDGFWNGSTPSNIGDIDGTAGTKIDGPNSQSYTYAPALPYADSGQLTDITNTLHSPAICPSNYTLQTSWTNKGKCQRNNSTTTSTPTCVSGYTYKSSALECQKTVTTSGVTYSDTLADVAMKYWMTDLRPTTSNEVPTNAEDPAFWQHMSTFTLGLGFTPVDDKGTSSTSDDVALDIPRLTAWANGDASKAITNFTWPQPGSDDLNNIADLAHAAINGHGGFYSATSPDAFASGLKDALKRAAERVGTGSSLAANSTQLQSGTVAYQANYWTAKWKGDLKALEVDSTSGAITTTDWTASTQLPDAASRNIKTYNPFAAAGSQFVDFKNASTTSPPALSSDQLAALAGTAAGQVDMVNYLRGDSSKEQTNKGSFRNRDFPIGDIVNSQPVYAGAPNANQFYTESFTGSSAFSQYASDQASRAGAIYVASNDGMLHGFDAGTGAENFAYLPGAVITAGVSALASVDYGGTVAHSFFNDGELTVGDAYIGSPASWKTVLVGTTGRGVAKTVYALDITNPASVKFLWERSAADGNTADGNSGYIGQMTGKPVIAQSANGTWSVLIGNGYNSPQGISALLQFNLADGTLNVHKTTDTSGLAAPAVWMDPSGNGVSTMAYAGDADGNVWSFAINTSAGTDTTATPSSDGVKLFTAKDASGTVQPITAGMLAGKDPATGNTWVFFGTGQYLTTADLGNLKTQTWYGLIVQSGTSGLAVTSTMTRTDNLVARSITAEVGNGRTVTTLAQAAANSAAITGKSGWYIDLLAPTGTGGAAVQQGERMVTPNQFQGNMLLGTTRIPQATDPCNPSGRGWIMALDPFTGTNPSANFFDLNGDGKIDSSDSVSGTPAAGIGFSSLPNNPIFVGSTMLTSFDNGSTSSIKTSSSTGKIQRVSWRELIAQ